MRKSYLVKPNVVEKTVTIKDLSKVTDYAEGLILGEQLTASNLYLAPSYSVTIEIRDMFNVDGKTYLRGYDGYLYQQTGLQQIQKIECGYMNAAMGSIILNGEKNVLFVDEKGVKIIDKSQLEIGLPSGKYFATYMLRCFVANDNTIYFSSPFDFEERSMMLDNCGNISINSQDGKILGIYDFSSYLLIVCEKSFYKLTIIDGEFSLEKLKCYCDGIAWKSLIKMNDKLLFIANKKLYVYENFAIKEIPTTVAQHITMAGLIATGAETLYFCTTNDPEKRSIFVYDFVKEKDSLLHVDNNSLCCKNILYNYDEQRLYAVMSGPNTASKWRSLAMNLGDDDKKSLIELSIKVTADSTLKISGDFGDKTFALKTGVNKKTMNLRSRAFAIEVNCGTSAVSIDNLQFKYIV
ncbi:MAG: hypothetical protein J6V71_00585 [Clostridia bacterium]|nr:hypothetical protein [Clostridia bacterium]